MSSRTLLLGALLSCLLVTPALAQDDTAYRSRQPTDELITNGHFTRSPLKLPFSLNGVQPTNKNGRTDFEHTYNNSFDEIVGYFENKDNRHAGFELFDTSIYTYARGVRLDIVGSQKIPNGRRFRFGYKTLSRSFILDVTRRGGQTVVTFQNSILTKVASGVMPARVGFKLNNVAKPVPYNWN